jgi:phage FluMu protein Com
MILNQWRQLIGKTVPKSVLYNMGNYAVTCGSCGELWRKRSTKETVLPGKCPYCSSINIRGKMEGTNDLEEIENEIPI